MNWAPIVLFTYNRPAHTRQALEALAANEGARKSDLFVYSDGPKAADSADSVQAVREYVSTVTGFRSVTVIEREQNLGLANSVIDGVTEVLNRFGSVVVVEDDLLTARNFLTFVNTALSVYGPRRDIFSVTGYSYPLRIPSTYREDAYLSYRGSSWGWGTWGDRWSLVDWSVSDYSEFALDRRGQGLFRRGGDDLPQMLEMQVSGRLDSWAVRFNYAQYKHDAFCVHPVLSKVQNIGFDGTGVHSGESDDYDVPLDPGDHPFRLRPDLALDPSVLRAFNREFRPGAGQARLRRGKRIVRRLVSSLR